MQFVWMSMLMQGLLIQWSRQGQFTSMFDHSATLTTDEPNSNEYHPGRFFSIKKQCSPVRWTQCKRQKVKEGTNNKGSSAAILEHQKE